MTGHARLFHRQLLARAAFICYPYGNRCSRRICAAQRGEMRMLAYTYVEQGRFELVNKPRPQLKDARDAIVRVTMSSICSSDLHIKHGSVPRAVPGITVGHEMVGVVEQVGAQVRKLRPGDRVAVNVETFCGECFFCRHGWVNNCTDPNGGWALGCRIDGGQAEYVRVPYAEQGLSLIPEGVSDLQALLVGDVLATGYWAAGISEITSDDTVLIIGAGPTGLCTLQCALLHAPRRIIVCDMDEARLEFVRRHYKGVLTAQPEGIAEFVRDNSDHGGADVVLEVAGSGSTFRMAWECARPNAIVTIVALYDRPQTLPLPDMYGKNLIFKTGGVDGCNCDETLRLIAEGKLDTTPLITHTFPLSDIEAAYRLFEEKRDGVIKIAIVN
jgi:alcohol dehydrogenase